MTTEVSNVLAEENLAPVVDPIAVTEKLTALTDNLRTMLSSLTSKQINMNVDAWCNYILESRDEMIYELFPVTGWYLNAAIPELSTDHQVVSVNELTAEQYYVVLNADGNVFVSYLQDGQLYLVNGTHVPADKLIALSMDVDQDVAVKYLNRYGVKEDDVIKNIIETKAYNAERAERIAEALSARRAHAAKVAQSRKGVRVVARKKTKAQRQARKTTR